MLRILALGVSLTIAMQSVQAAEAGKIIFVAGSVQVAGQAAQQGLAVQEGDALDTGADGYVYIKTVDNGLFILRPNSRARIVEYHVDTRTPANTRVKLELLGGVARSQSGEAVKKARQNFRFNTPVAAIGVRGTDFTVFTDSDTSRVAVMSGAVTVSGFAGSCSPQGAGPCEGAAARELSAAQKGQMLQIQRGQAAPQQLHSGSVAPDIVAPPRSDEPVAKSSATEPSLDPRKSENLTAKLQVANDPVAEVKPPVAPVAPPPLMETVEPEREVTWGRWQAVAALPANSTLSKAGATRIAANETHVLFRSDSGAQYTPPLRGSAGFALTNAEASVRDTATQLRSRAAVTNGQLMVDFEKASFTTSFDALHQGERFKMSSTGVLDKDGIISSYNRLTPADNMTVNGVIGEKSATYLFQGLLTERRVISGVTSWVR